MNHSRYLATWVSAFVIFSCSAVPLSSTHSQRAAEATSEEAAIDRMPQTDSLPFYEMRGAWLTTVVNLDWPSSRTLLVSEQQQEMRDMLDQLKSLGFNAVLFQVRSESDAMYPSPYEPWSYWLTNEQGRAPEPFYDPLAFVVEEGHRRGLEVHAWLNPYRAHRSLGSYAQHSSHIAMQRPDWILSFTGGSGTYSMLNPGKQVVRDFIANVVTDLVRRYDVDGVHFDDYFYPYAPKITTEDAADFVIDPRGFSDIGDWRRDNVLRLIVQVNDSIRSVDPFVKFGISPFGIRLNADAGTNGSEGYHMIYADPLAWLEQGSVDYITPQIYWERAHPVAPYEPLVDWWSRVSAEHGRHLYVGMAPYRLSPPHNWPASEIGAQLRINRSPDRQVQGSVFFRTKSITGNFKSITDSLETNWHRYPALTPPMDWKPVMIPEPVDRLTASPATREGVALSWEPSQGARRYVISRFPASMTMEEIMSQQHPSRVVAITGETEFADIFGLSQLPMVYMVQAVGRNSELSLPRLIYVE